MLHTRLSPRSIPREWLKSGITALFSISLAMKIIRLSARVGSEFQNYLPQTVRDCALTDVPAASLIEHAASYYHEILDRGVPISRGGEFIKYDGMKVLYRSIILPMSDDGSSVSGLLGAANCREVPSD